MPDRILYSQRSHMNAGSHADSLIGALAYLPNKACGFTLYDSLNRNTTRTT